MLSIGEINYSGAGLSLCQPHGDGVDELAWSDYFLIVILISKAPQTLRNTKVHQSHHLLGDIRRLDKDAANSKLTKWNSSLVTW